MGTFDADDPYISVAGQGRIDCRNRENFSLLTQAFPDKFEQLEQGNLAASQDLMMGKKTRNPYSKLLSPLKWTAWNSAYWFMMKHAANRS